MKKILWGLLVVVAVVVATFLYSGGDNQVKGEEGVIYSGQWGNEGYGFGWPTYKWGNEGYGFGWPTYKWGNEGYGFGWPTN